jgi:hypothetical protein
MTLSQADVAYCAALIDNLAALRTRQVGPSTLPVVQVSGKWGVLSWLAEITGTKVIETRRKYTRHNCTEHCPSRHSDITSRSGRWSITGMRAVIVLLNCEKYMRVQESRARELIDAGLAATYQGQVVNDMRRRGWEIPPLAEHPRARVPIERSTA